jgi:hypothetical protein
VNRTAFSLVGVFLSALLGLALSARPVFAQEGEAIPAATRTDIECSGFIQGTKISNDQYVVDGADNDFRRLVHQFAQGSYVYLRSRSGGSFQVGAEYRIVRPAKELARVKWYPAQGGSIRSLGHWYEDVAVAKVLRNAPHGAIAQVTFSCSAIYPDDLVIPFQARPIPQYVPTPMDRFSLPNGKQLGAITATARNTGYTGQEQIVHINLGTEDGVRPGQRFRIFKIFREGMERGFRVLPETPRETLGQLVVLTTYERSSTAKVISSIREISLGDGLELE